MKYGRYEIRKELGKGAMGVVYQAHDPQIDRMVALKVLRQDRVSGEDFVQRFLKEARAIGRLSHPNIVTVYDVGNDQNTIFIAMEFLDGRPLDEAFQSTTASLEEIVRIGEKVAQALDYSHQRGIVHRDIKPSNIMLTQTGQVFLTDFGIARIEDPAATQMTQAGEIMGTPNYMSPEQVRGESVDGRSDLYSLGVILYELSTGRRPYTGKNLAGIFHAILNQAPASPMELEPFVSRGLPSKLSETLLKSIEKAPEDRFQNGADMADALARCLPGAAPPQPAQAPARRTSKSATLRALIIGIVAILLAGGGFFYFRGMAKHPPETPAQAPLPQTALVVTSDPPGARLYMDGTFKGQSPLRLELPIGTYEARLSLPGYYEWEGQLQLQTTDEIPLNIQLLKMEEENGGAP